jgi:pimeloyl-ACP methyl ester carboxylesterase
MQMPHETFLISKVEYIVAAPWARGTMGYMGIPEEDVMRVIEECKSNFKIDENRVFLTGLSMGGGGTLYIGLTRPDLFAAIAPVCPAPPADVYELMGNALNLPVSLHQGGADPVVKPKGTRLILDDFLKAGTMVEYHEYPGVQHDSWDNAYANGAIFEWFDGQCRNPFPERVRYAAKWYKYNAAYWVLFDKITPGTLATIDAKFTGPNQLDIQTGNLDAFTLKLNGHPRFEAMKPLIVKIDGQQLQSSPKFNHSFILKNGKWVTEKYEAPVIAKKPGLEGPMCEAFTSRHLVVYGTQGAEGMEQMMERREMAKQVADFSVSLFGYYEQPSLVNPRIIPDTQLSETDILSSNLILVGTKETNSVIARFADKLPMQLKADAEGYGLVYSYPVNGKYIMVCSGVPFWTAKPIDWRTPPAPAVGARPVTSITFSYGIGAKVLLGRKDFLLFKDTNDNVIAEGYFDNDWKLKEEDAKKIEDSGIVIMNR